MIVPLKLPIRLHDGSLKERASESADVEIEGQYTTVNEQTHLTSADLQGGC